MDKKIVESADLRPVLDMEKHSEESEESTMTTKEAAEALGISIRRVQKLIQEGRLKATKKGRDWNISRKSVEEYPDTRKRKPKGKA